jgi:hypothetical protein
MNSILDRGSVAVGALQQRDVMNSILDRGSVAVGALQQRDVMNSILDRGSVAVHGRLRGAWRGQALPDAGLPRGRCSRGRHAPLVMNLQFSILMAQTTDPSSWR